MSRTFAARSALALTIASAIWIVWLAVFGGFEFSVGPLALRSHRLLPAIAALAVGAIGLALAGPHTLQQEIATLPRLAGAFAAAAAVATLLVGITWGTGAAGGSDSYCYLSQARLLASGRVTVAQAWVASLPWADIERAAVPAGYTAAPGPSGTIAPMCPAGLAVLMALAGTVGDEQGMLLVVPLLGAWGVWLTYRTGLRVTSRGAAAAAAAIVAASPTVLYQVVQPMSDVPAMTFWLAAICAASGPMNTARALASGAAAAAALLVRPNLLPLALVMLVWIVVAADGGSGGRQARDSRLGVSYAAGLLPAVVIIAVIHTAMYGTPWRSGYASLGALFRFEHGAPNLARYPMWLLGTHSPAIALALAAPLTNVDDRVKRRRWLLLAFAAVNFVCYLFYTPFDDWWYLRFMLPAIPCLILLVVAVADDWLRRLRACARVIVALALVVAAVTGYAHVAEARGVFRLRSSEERFIATGRYIADTLPDDAIVVAAFQSGSVRYYSGRRTLAWDALAPAEFDEVIDGLMARGLSPVLILETWEEARFRAAFASGSRYGQLDWPPRAQVGRDVRVWDPADRARYRAGEPVPTARIWIDERR